MSSPQNPVAAAVSTIANAVPTSTEELQAKLAEAKDQIVRLTQQVEDQVLRQRKTDGSSANQGSKGEHARATTTSMAMPQGPTEGVPVPIVAALCFLSFLLAYFLF